MLKGVSITGLIMSLLILTGCALSPNEFHCKADAGLGCHRLDEVNAWVERGLFESSAAQKGHPLIWHASDLHQG